MTTAPLRNCTIVVTRPVAQAGKLIEKLERLGADVTSFPVIAISAAENHQQLLTQVKSLGTYDIAIFISRNAAIYGSELIKQTGGWPNHTQIAAIGDSTARQLQKQGLTTDIVASGVANSENLLSTRAMSSVNGKRIAIFRGNGGREILADSLRNRGAVVDYIECYKRKLPNTNHDVLTRLWDKNTLHGIIITSAEGLKNLYKMVKKDDLARLNITPIYVISSTMVELSGKLGYKLTPIQMASARDDDVVEAVLANCSAKTQ